MHVRMLEVFSSKSLGLKFLAATEASVWKQLFTGMTTLVLIIWPTGQLQGVFWNDTTLNVQITFWQLERKMKQSHMETYSGFSLKLASEPPSSTRGSVPYPVVFIFVKGSQRNWETFNASLHWSILTSAFGL